MELRDLKALKKLKRQTVPANEVGRDFVIGDLHGCYSFLMRALDEAKFDYSNDRLFSVGDLYDRGPDNELCASLASEKWFNHVRGNHEMMALDHFIAAAAGTLGPYESDWVCNGGQWAANVPHRRDPLAADIYEHIIDTFTGPDLITVQNPNGTPWHVIHAEFDVGVTRSPLTPLHHTTTDDLVNAELMTVMQGWSSNDEVAVHWRRALGYQLCRLESEVEPHYPSAAKRLAAHHNDGHLLFDYGFGMIYSGHTPVGKPQGYQGAICRPVQYGQQRFIDTHAYKSIVNPSVDRYGTPVSGNDSRCGLTLVCHTTDEVWFSNSGGVVRNTFIVV